MRKLLTYLMLFSTLFTHAQCMQVHHSDGWTEEIPVNQIDSIAFSDSTSHLAPTVTMNTSTGSAQAQRLQLTVLGLGTYSLQGDVCFNSVYTALKNGYRLIDTAYTCMASKRRLKTSTSLTSPSPTARWQTLLPSTATRSMIGINET